MSDFCDYVQLAYNPTLQAIKCYTRALKLDPNHEQALDAISVLLGKMNKAEEAIKW